MCEKEKEQTAPETEAAEQEDTAPPEEAVTQDSAAEEAVAEETAEEIDPVLAELEALKTQLAEGEDRFLRLAAEYDNFRRRSKQEKDNLYAEAKADAVKALLPVYDNLERALKQETADEAYKKGVEMTMTGLRKAFEGLGVTEIDAVGQSFDPNIHNAVMHIEDDTLGENMVAEVFQTGFMLGEKVIRFAMVKVAN